MRRRPSAYQIRDELLLQLGFASYADYLGSRLWWTIRAAVMAKHRSRCAFCPRRATQVHHNSYTLETLAGADISDLYPSCRPCHVLIEFLPDGTKRTMRGVKSAVRNMLARKKPRPVRTAPIRVHRRRPKRV